MALTNFLLHTDYPIDKIIGTYTGSITVPASGFNTATIAHGLGFAPLPISKWSLSPDFTTSYDEIGVSIINNANFRAETDGTNLYLYTGNNSTGGITIYYRILYFMPSDSTATAAPTTAGLDSFFLNTDYNYTKIIDEGTLPGGTQVVTHSLGYYPQCEVWYRRSSDSQIVHLIENEVVTFSASPNCEVTTTSIILNENSTPVTNYYYRIYADES